MRRFFLTLVVSLIFVSAAHAVNTEISVSPTNLNTLLYSFSVSTNATHRGVAFHITITHRRFDIYPDSSAEIGTIEYKEITNNFARRSPELVKIASFKPLNPKVKVALKKENRVWTADFSASRDLLKNTNACFVFSVFAGDPKTNKTAPADLYELKLHDFAKP